MSTTRRIPLSSNQNVANSPIRASTTAKPKRPIASLQQEDYAQAPPAKKQILESGIPRPSRSPTKTTFRDFDLQTRRHASTYESKLARERAGHQRSHTTSRVNNAKYTAKDLDEIRLWQNHHRAKFPTMVFYLDHIPTDARVRVAKQIASLGAREEKFFSKEITHVVTTRSIPPEKSARQRQEEPDAENAGSKDNVENTENHEEPSQEQVETINPTLLNRIANRSVKRNLFAHPTAAIIPRREPAPIQDSRPKRNVDILQRAREMQKKVWSLDKLQRMLSMLLEPDLHATASIAYGSRSAQEPDLVQLLNNERVNGPSDRDLSVATRELHFFKGPYIYVYDFEEKQKPIMVREYGKVQDKSDGDWPQFRTAPLGRCPFIEDYDHREIVKPKAQSKQQNAKPVIGTKPVLQPPEAQPPKPVTGKRSLSEMESAHNRGSSVVSTDLMTAPKPSASKAFDFRPNIFTGRPATGRLFGGEPVASGVQPSNVTSAIRSQMISSTAATPGAIGVLSEKVHGLQRQVLQRNSSHDLSSRRTAGSVDNSFRDDSNSSKRTATLGRTSSRRLELIEEKRVASVDGDDKLDLKAQPPADKRVVAKPKKRDPKPGYCENCQDKFEDFDDHILSRKHRKFADNLDNWTELDDLLAQLERMPRHKSFSSWTPSLPKFSIP